MKKLLIWLVVGAVLVTMAFVGVACKAATTTTAVGETTATAAKAKVIGYYMDAADDYYKAGFQVFEALGKEKGWQINSVVGQGTAPEQLSNVQNFITQKVDGIVLAPTDRKALVPYIERAAKEGIPLTIFDSGADTDAYISFVATNNYQGGVMAAERMAEILGAK